MLDTGIFDEDRYLDVFIEYAKAGPQDVLMRVTAHNRGSEPADLHLLPTLWFRNCWTFGDDSDGVPSARPALELRPNGTVMAGQVQLGRYALHADGRPEWLFCENETNLARLYNVHTGARYSKDGINDYVIRGAATVNPDKNGTKAAAHYRLSVPAGGAVTIQLRLEATGSSLSGLADPFAKFDALMSLRKAEADNFYAEIQPAKATADERLVQRQAFAGTLWSKQFYYYDVSRWLAGDPGGPPPPPERRMVITFSKAVFWV